MRMTLLEKRKWNLKVGSTRLHSEEISLWKRLWICHKSDCTMIIDSLLVGAEWSSLCSVIFLLGKEPCIYLA